MQKSNMQKSTVQNSTVQKSTVESVVAEETSSISSMDSQPPSTTRVTSQFRRSTIAGPMSVNVTKQPYRQNNKAGPEKGIGYAPSSIEKKPVAQAPQSKDKELVHGQIAITNKM